VVDSLSVRAGVGFAADVKQLVPVLLNQVVNTGLEVVVTADANRAGAAVGTTTGNVGTDAMIPCWSFETPCYSRWTPPCERTCARRAEVP
jgi:hypothetical protein